MDDGKLVLHEAHCFEKSRYVDSKDRYVVTLHIHNMPKAEYWLTRKQFEKLSKCFGDSEYSRKGNRVYVVLRHMDSGKDFFVWSGVNEDDKAWMMTKFDISETDIESQVGEQDYE